jgi:DNA-binding FrmR family transcriptional regulator
MITDKTIKEIKPRLKRIEGQIRGISNMIENKEYCIDILQQISAVIGALKSINLIILEGHLNTCVKKAIQSKDEAEINAKIKELIEMYKKF